MSINSNSTNLQLDTKRHSFAHLMACAVQIYFKQENNVNQKLNKLLKESLVTGRAIFVDCLIINDKGEVFAQKRTPDRRKFPKCWDLPGGGLEDGETIFDCVKRELKEELDFELNQIIDIVHVQDFDLPVEMRSENENYQQRVIQVIITVKDYSNPILEAGKSDRYDWFDSSKLEILMEGRDGATEADRYTQTTVKRGLDYQPKIIQFGVGPVIENGCYYDFILPRNLVPEDLKGVTKVINDLIKKDLVFESKELKMEEAVKLFKSKGQLLKVELLENLRDKGTTSLSEEEKSDLLVGETPIITTYSIRNTKTDEVIFEDLCKGPHISSLDDFKIAGFQLDKFSASYWRGDQDRGINMQRLYAVVFDTVKELEDYNKQIEEAKKRDHRILGEQLDIFAFSDLIGKGLPLWLPRGKVLIDLLEKWAAQEEKKQGYQPVATPLITKENLFLTSGHLPMYRDSMYSPMDIDGENYYIKPMNCPFHHQVFAARKRSYRELPLRFSEYGFCHRYEDSGSLFGLMRTRAMKMNDAHIYCTIEQAVDEFVKSVDLIKLYFKELNITDYWLELALRDPANGKYHKDEAMWQKAEALSKEACDKAGVDYVIINDGAAFYGPKIDVQMKSAIGKVYTCSTSQIDLYTPTKFNLIYTDEHNNEITPLVIHRAPLSTEVRMIGFLLEHFAGKFPFWLAPEQLRILTINDQVLSFVDQIKEILNETVLMKPLKYNEIRYAVDSRSESLGKKIREAKLEKIPMLMVIGQKDVDANEVSIEYNGESVKVSLSELKNWLEGIK